MTTTSAPASLPWSGDDEADQLDRERPQRTLDWLRPGSAVDSPKSILGPRDCNAGFGHLDPARIAATDPAELEAVFKQKPAIHRFPSSMATRVQALCAFVAERYDGDGGRVWTEATSGADLKQRLGELPGIGDMKVRSLIATLVKQFGVRPDGYAEVLPNHPTLGDVDSAEALASYQAGKRAAKAAKRAAAS